MTVALRLLSIKRELPPHCKLIAVGKTHPPEKILEAYEAGHRLFGENKVQELVPKYEGLPKDVAWHMIGHMQSNKVKFIAPFVDLIHGCDSVKLLDEINKQGLKCNRVIPCLLQIHIAREETKFGFSEDEVTALTSAISNHDWKHVKIAGLMGMATFTENSEQIRNEFRSLKQLFDKMKNSKLAAPFQIGELSMGMSGDYQIAVEEGSTMVRIGTSIFGERNYQH
jgi:pyridoxal phosphate enzyme (YggS family)